VGVWKKFYRRAVAPGRTRNVWGEHPIATIRFRPYYPAMRNKFNLTGLVITGTAALFVGLAGNMQAIPTSMDDQSVSDVLQSANLSQQDQSIVTLTPSELAKSIKEEKAIARHEAALLAKSLKAEKVAARKEAALLAKSLKTQKLVASRKLPASHFNPFAFGMGASETSLPPITENPSPIYIPTGLTPYVYEDPDTTSLGQSQSGTTGHASSANAVSVPDGGMTATLMAGAFGGLVFLKRKHKSGSRFSTAGI
jgi:hypothetical protein